MKKGIFTLAAIILSGVLATSSFATTPDAAKRADIAHLLELTNATAMGQQFANATLVEIMQILKLHRPDLDAKGLDVIVADISDVLNENMGSFNELIINIYDQHISHEDVKAMIAFYETDAGKRLIELMPTLIQEGMVAGQQWAESLQPQLQARITKRLAATE